MVVKKISVGNDALHLEGNRVAYLFDRHEKRLVPIRAREAIRIKIRLNAPLGTTDEAAIVLRRIFALTRDDILDSVPLPWQDYLEKQIEPDPVASAAENIGPEQKGPLSSNQTEAPRPFKLGDPGVTPPKVLWKPEPEFSTAARNNEMGGVVGLKAVLNSKGRVDQVSIVHPVGMGLDENAIEAVKSWRFQPATKDGIPVAVSVFIEVDFHLYKQR